MSTHPFERPAVDTSSVDFTLYERELRPRLDGASEHCHICLSSNHTREHPVRSLTPTVSVVIPTMNEARNLPWVMSRLPESIDEVIVVDGHSTDDTREVAAQYWPGVRILEQSARGKGAALAAGLAAASTDIVVMIDADGSMDPREIPAYVGSLLAGADVVKGSRNAAAGGSHDISAIRNLGNSALSVAANRLFGQSWSELCYGYAAFWTDVIPQLGVADLAEPVITTPVDRLTRRLLGVAAHGKSTAPRFYGHGFEIEAVLFCRAAAQGLRVAEVFSFEYERHNGESNLATWRDGLRVLSAVLRERRTRGQVAALEEIVIPAQRCSSDG